MVIQKYVYEDLVINAEYTTNYVIIHIYRDNVKAQTSITYLDEVKISSNQILIRLIEMVIGKSFDLKELEIVKTEYIDD